jgi:hypothetical protein
MKIRLTAPYESSADALASPFPVQRVNLPLLGALVDRVSGLAEDIQPCQYLATLLKQTMNA